LELAILVAIAVVFVIGATLTYLQLKQIHSAVNSNMTAALNKIDELHGRVAQLVDERDGAVRKTSD
jgi:outer membrane lipoprotein-sorting protein